MLSFIYFQLIQYARKIVLVSLRYFLSVSDLFAQMEVTEIFWGSLFSALFKFSFIRRQNLETDTPRISSSGIHDDLLLKCFQLYSCWYQTGLDDFLRGFRCVNHNFRAKRLRVLFATTAHAVKEVCKPTHRIVRLKSECHRTLRQTGIFGSDHSGQLTLG